MGLHMTFLILENVFDTMYQLNSLELEWGSLYLQLHDGQTYTGIIKAIIIESCLQGNEVSRS